MKEENDSDKIKLNKINKKVFGQKNNYRKYIELSFHKYIFENSKTQFERIKKLCFLYILKYKYFKDNYLIYAELAFLLNNYNVIIECSKNLQYIDRIRLLLAFTNNRLFDNEYNTKSFSTYLINLNDLKDEFTYLKNAYKILYQILDNLNESSSFFIALHQLNSYIGYSFYSNNKMYTSSILTVEDVKLDFIKNNHEYFFVNKIENVKTYSYLFSLLKIDFL